jgi:hypothetical protein
MSSLKMKKIISLLGRLLWLIWMTNDKQRRENFSTLWVVVLEVLLQNT